MIATAERRIRAALAAAVMTALPPQNQTPKPADVQAMVAALPEKAPVHPRRPRRVLVLGKALGYVHASIPLAARTIEEMGRKTGTWSTTVTYDPADINGLLRGAWPQREGVRDEAVPRAPSSWEQYVLGDLKVDDRPLR